MNQTSRVKRNMFPYIMLFLGVSNESKYRYDYNENALADLPLRGDRVMINYMPCLPSAALSQ